MRGGEPNNLQCPTLVMEVDISQLSRSNPLSMWIPTLPWMALSPSLASFPQESISQHKDSLSNELAGL